MNTTNILYPLDKPISYSNKQEIFTDLSLEIDEMDGLIQIFEQYGPFKYLASKKYIYLSIPKEEEGEHIFAGIKFYFYKK